MYSAKNNETGEVITMTEEQVRAEIISTYQCDMGMVLGDGLTDEQIAEGVTNDNLEDHFDGNTFEGSTYEITRDAQ